MLKYLLLAGLVFFVWLAWKKAAPAVSPPPARPPESMVVCAHCGVHLPASVSEGWAKLLLAAHRAAGPGRNTGEILAFLGLGAEWRSFQYFNLYRLIVAALVLAGMLFRRPEGFFSSRLAPCCLLGRRRLPGSAGGGGLILSVRWQRHFDLQLSCRSGPTFWRSTW